MTSKIYKSAQGKSVDIGQLALQNEQVRAVGNMGVNARGDRLDSNNRVIDQKNQQVNRQYQRQSNVSATPVHTSNISAKQALVPDADINSELSELDNPITNDLFLHPTKD